MKRLIADLHMHTIASGHAYGTIREMAQAASERGLQLIGLSEHAPGIPGTVNPFYYLNLQVIPRELYGVEILHGSEINVLPGGELSLEERYINRLDYAIIGVHTPCYQDGGRENNTRDIIRCMENLKVRFVSHPDDSRLPLDYTMLARGAREHGVALEVNNTSLARGIRPGCRENYHAMLSECQKYRVPVLVNSDAHDPSWVGEFTAAVSLLEEIGFDEELILNNDAAKIKAFLCGEPRRFPGSEPDPH